MNRSIRILLLVFTLLAGFALRANTDEQQEQARVVVHMLDYVSADYPEFVVGGVVLNEDEFAEQQEFALQVRLLLEQLPAPEVGGDLVAMARKLQERIDAKADGLDIVAIAGALRVEVIAAYDVAVAPDRAPALAQAPALYQAHCASCHGSNGDGHGPQAAGLDPEPRNFLDGEAMGVRSTFGLYNTISLGVPGTSMMAYKGLSEEERWALAFYTASMRFSQEELRTGKTLWEQGQGKDDFSNLTALVSAAPVELTGPNADALRRVLAYLLAHPEAVQAMAPSPLDLTRDHLARALAAYREGDVTLARRLSISGYLEGFELVEAALDNLDRPLRVETEREMMGLRGLISKGAPADEVQARIAKINVLLDRADALLSDGSMSNTASFLSSLLIMLREGLEAILVLAAIIAFVLKTGRKDAMPYIHAGWILAVVAGVITWLVARYVISISGASREMTEGVAALLAAVMLLYVGFWLHNKSNAKAWQGYVKGKVGAALGKRTLWALAGIAFLAVYRELFEIILFYETLFGQAGPEGQQAVWAGIGVALVLLAIIATAILKFSVRIPLGPFFAITGILLALMAVVFTGNGIAALQEAGLFDAMYVNFVTIPLLGIHPTIQGLWAQGIVMTIVLLVLFHGRIRSAFATKTA